MKKSLMSKGEISQHRQIRIPVNDGQFVSELLRQCVDFRFRVPREYVGKGFER